MNNILKYLILVAIALFFVHGDPQNSMRLLRTSCLIHDKVDVINSSCWASPVNRTYGVGNVYLHLTKPFNNVFIHFQLYKKTDVKYRPFLMDTKEDYCAFFKNNKGTIYLRLMYQMYAPYSNLNHSCPYMGDIVIKDFPMDPNILPSLWPAGEYRLDVHVSNLEVNKFTMVFYFELKELRNRH